MRYPEVRMPDFNGDRDKFNGFWAVFHQMVHLNASFSKIEKFIYLTNQLTDSAASAIQGIKLFPENYEQAIGIIVQTFGNKDRNLASVIQLIHSIAPANESTAVCIYVFEKRQAHLQQLKSLAYDIIDQSDPLWKEFIFDRFPQSIQKDLLLEMQRQKEIPWMVKHTMEKIGALITVRELFEKRIEESSITSVSVKLGIGDQLPPAANRKYCHFCQRQGHRNLECLTFRSPSDRRQCNKSRNCCWKCFSADHTSNNCNRPNCNICGKNHSRLPCLETDLTTPLKANDQNQ